MRLITMLMLPLVTLSSQQPDGNAIIGRAANAWAATNTFTADFRQRIEDPLVTQPETRGTLYQSGQGRFAMRFTDPEGGAIVMDGSKVWVYLPDEMPNQVMRYPMPSSPVYGYNVIGWLMDRPTERYRVTWVREETIDGVKTDALLMEPTVPDMPFRRATVWIDREGSMPRKAEIDERPGMRRIVTLSRIRRNTPIAPAMFTFRVPGGVKIIDQ